MSELSAKHKALNILRVLTAEKDHKVQTSPRQDLSGSQEVLAGKYRELATLLATQYVERKTVARLQSVDLVSRSSGSIPSPRGQRYHGNRVKSVRKKHRKVTVASLESDHRPKIVNLTSCEDENKKDASRLYLVLEQPPKPLLHKKTVSFSDARLEISTDDNASSSTNVSDTEVIRSILRSPRKVLTGEVHPSPPVSVGRRTVKKQHSPSKRKLQHKETAKCSPEKKLERTGSPSRGSPEDSQTKKEFHPSDNKLSSSSNPDILSWLREKNKITRKQKRSERKKELEEQQAEQRVVNEKLRRQAESEDKVTQWMKHKQDDSLTKRQTERKIQKVIKQREALQHIERVQESNQVSSPIKSATVSRTQLKSTSSAKTNKSKSTIKTQKTVPRTTENVSDNQRCFEEETKHHLVRNLEAERLHTEEKRQRKEAEKRQKRLLTREANNSEAAKKSDTQSSNNATSKLPTETKHEGSCNRNNRKNMPSSNPFKGLTYDEWLRQKQTDQKKRATRAKKQDVGDPELDDLIPLLARRRIEQIKVRATHVDSGLRKSRNSPKLENKPERPRTQNGVRPYTWEQSTFSNEKPKETKRIHLPTKSRQSDKTDIPSFVDRANNTKHKMVASMPDVVNFERPEPQGCEGTESSLCQSSVVSQSRETKDCLEQSKQNLNKLKHCSANAGDETIFMTEPNT